ncbi:armadillo-type protein [Xylariaceae sp. FL0016]|nr:armadillo-type protein [Xylariaceae sp. FL0016]
MAAQPVNGNMGMGGRDSAQDHNVVSTIHASLEIVYNPHSSSNDRNAAQKLLEEIKASDEAPSHGYQLASSKDQSPVVRHYALSLLEYPIKLKWADYNKTQAGTLRNWVMELSQNISPADPAYLRNKIASLWVEVAKRTWAAEWMDMDMRLVQLWQMPDSAVHKEFVLTVLEILSDEIFSGQDPVVTFRETVLSKASVEIFTPAAVLADVFPDRQAGPDVRYGEEGWLGRVTDMLRHCLSGDLQNNQDLRSCVIRGLGLIYALMPWAIPRAVFVTGCVPVLCEGLRASHIDVQKASLEAMHALYSRTSLNADEFVDLVVPLYNSKYINLFKQLFQWSSVDPEDIDDDKYHIAQKLSEVVHFLGNYLDRRFAALPSDPSQRVDLQGFLQLLLLIVQSPSLLVSIHVLVTWTRLLHHPTLGPNIAQIPAFIGPLLELCSSRLVRYESLPEDTPDHTLLFLIEDTDTVPERHAFLGNYRRYSSLVVENIVQLQMKEAIQHILNQTQNVLEHLYDHSPGFDVTNYSKVSKAVLRVDAQATVIESALKGYVKWRLRLQRDGQIHDEVIVPLEDLMETWCNRLLEMKFEDPLIRRRILQGLVAFSTMALEKRSGFMFKVLQHILLTWPAPQPDHKLYSDAVKDLQQESMTELQRLAINMPDELIKYYGDIETQVKEMVASGSLDEKRQISYQTFLFTIVLRSTGLDDGAKMQKLQEFIEPVKARWQDDHLKQLLSSHSGFCELLALDKAQRYIAHTRMHEIQDWGAVELDAEGRALQLELEERQQLLPLRPTKAFLTCSTDKVEKDSPMHHTSAALWQEGFTIILPQLLSFLNHAHASSSPDTWSILPAEMRSIVGRILTDRFWQAGISEGSKDDFYARVLDKKSTLEGLASSIRGSIRFARESCYAIIYCMSRLPIQFYGFSELPGPLAEALLARSSDLSAHQLINLLNLVRYLVDNCPVKLREHFLPSLLRACFQQTDARIVSDWDKLTRQQEVRSDGDALTEEMKAESLLRQLTYTSVMQVADFLDPARRNIADGIQGAEQQRKYPSLRSFCLMHVEIAEPMLVFCTHVIRIRDSRCCGIMLKVLRSIVPDFAVTEQGLQQSMEDDPETELRRKSRGLSIAADAAYHIREYIASEIVKACCESLHESYFVDLQKDIAALVATILTSYQGLTATARNVLTILPGMEPGRVDETIQKMTMAGVSSRQQRSYILELFGELKGKSVADQGKLDKSMPMSVPQTTSKKPARSKMAQKFMNAPDTVIGGHGGQTSGNVQADGSELEGVASLFDS